MGNGPVAELCADCDVEGPRPVAELCAEGNGPASEGDGPAVIGIVLRAAGGGIVPNPATTGGQNGRITSVLAPLHLTLIYHSPALPRRTGAITVTLRHGLPPLLTPDDEGGPNGGKWGNHTRHPTRLYSRMGEAPYYTLSYDTHPH